MLDHDVEEPRIVPIQQQLRSNSLIQLGWTFGRPWNLGAYVLRPYSRQFVSHWWATGTFLNWRRLRWEHRCPRCGPWHVSLCANDRLGRNFVGDGFEWG